MEVLFDCFFEETFKKLERSGLQARKKRKDVIDHLNAIISGCCQGQNLKSEESAKLAVVAAINYHREKKTDNNEVCLMGKFHNVLYIGLKVAWDWGVTDSLTIQELLEEIYQCEQTFERIFLGAIFGSNAPHFIAGWKSDFLDQNENIRAMVYYLQHASCVRLQFPVYLNKFEGTRMIRFVDVPLESCGKASPMRVALQATAPDILLILLRYGASSYPRDGGTPPVISILDKLIELRGTHHQSQLNTCLKIILKTMPQIEMPYKPYSFEFRKNLFMQKYEQLFEDGTIRQEHVFGVMELKHLCRCKIREHLQTNYELPCGIQSLKIPRSLRHYVDLVD